MSKKDVVQKQTPVDVAAAGITVLFAVLISLFAIRNNDIWWLLAVGRRIAETKEFITEDPFTFTATGMPWAPQAYLSALIFYAVYQMASATGLIVVRALLVLGIFAISFRTLGRLGVSWAIAAPVAMLVLLNAHSRFIVRAHLFEYLFVVILVGFLLAARTRKGKSFFVIPVIVQLLWVNMHPSYMLGPALVVVFFVAEWISGTLSNHVSFIQPLHKNGYDWRRVGILVALMAAVCFVNPAPGLFLTQPLGGEQRELISRFTLEWRSPFDPALRAGAFHPYYEILLGLAVVSILASVTRLPLAPAILVAATAYMSLKSHRFRVEFALVSLPMIFVLFEASPLVRWVRNKLRNAKSYSALGARLTALAVALVLIVTALDRISVGDAVADRYPDKAYDFVKAENIAHRPFHTIGFGSYLVWDLYGERQSFIDGRNFSPGLHQDFLACQSSANGPRGIAVKYNLDAFIIPSPKYSDAGMENIHRVLARDQEWTLVYLDRRAWVYVNKKTVNPAWLTENGYTIYHPITLPGRQLGDGQTPRLIAEIKRAAAAAADYVQPRLDLAFVYAVTGQHALASEELEAARKLDPDNPVIWSRIGNAALISGQHTEAVSAFQRLQQIAPENPVSWLNLGAAYAAVGDRQQAIAAFEKAASLNPNSQDAYEALFELNAREGIWDEAMEVAQRMVSSHPGQYRGYYLLAVANAGMGRQSEALKHAQTALRCNGSAGEVYLFVADLYAQRKDYAKTREYLERALAIDPNNSAALDMQERLRSSQP